MLQVFITRYQIRAEAFTRMHVGCGVVRPNMSIKNFVVLDDPRQPEVHASTVVVHPDTGIVSSAWFGGTKEGHGDTKIW